MNDPLFWKLGLVGSPISHSLSPDIHRAAFAACGLTGDYYLYERNIGELESLLEELRTGAVHGLNVTIPHKETLLEYCDELDSVAELVGAVNTLVCKQDQIIGYNTDVEGLETALLSQWPTAPWRGRTCTIHGAGGAARAACVALKNIGVGEIRIVNRTFERAVQLAGTMSARLGIPCIAAEACDAFKDTALVIQAASLGVNDLEREEIVRRSKELMELSASDCVLMDLVYKPMLPAFAVGARLVGREAVGGLGMLVHQARRSFELWTGRQVGTDLLGEVVRFAGQE